MTDHAYRAAIRDLVNLREAEARAARTASLPDPDSLLDADPDTIPTQMKMQPCPPCHSSCPIRRADYLETRSATRQRHLEASVQWRTGDFAANVPAGTYRP